MSTCQAKDTTPSTGEPYFAYSNLRATVQRVSYGRFPTNFFFPFFIIVLLFCDKKGKYFEERKKIDEKKFKIENFQNN